MTVGEALVGAASAVEPGYMASVHVVMFVLAELAEQVEVVAAAAAARRSVVVSETALRSSVSEVVQWLLGLVLQVVPSLILPLPLSALPTQLSAR
jgi:hypothetical protein